MRLKQYNTPYRAEFISWSCSPKAAVPFREKLSAVIAPSCRAPLMFLPLASKTWSKGWASSLFALGFNRNLGHVTQTARQSLWRHPLLLLPPHFKLDPPPYHHLLLPPFCSPCLLLIILFSVFEGTLRGGRCWAFCTVCNKLWVVTQNWGVCPLSACKDHHWKCHVRK